MGVALRRLAVALLQAAGPIRVLGRGSSTKSWNDLDPQTTKIKMGDITHHNFGGSNRLLSWIFLRVQVVGFHERRLTPRLRRTHEQQLAILSVRPVSCRNPADGGVAQRNTLLARLGERPKKGSGLFIRFARSQCPESQKRNIEKGGGRKEAIQFRKEVFSFEPRAVCAGEADMNVSAQETCIARKLAQAPSRKSSLRPRFEQDLLNAAQLASVSLLSL